MTKDSEWMTFHLAGELYAVDILAVKEIRSASKVTRIPLAESEVMGAINLRGEVVPIVDLRTRLALEQADDTQDTVFVIVQYESSSRNKTLGVRVDSVADVIKIKASDIDKQNQGDKDSCVEALAQHDAGSVALLNVTQLLNMGQSERLEMELE